MARLNRAIHALHPPKPTRRHPALTNAHQKQTFFGSPGGEPFFQKRAACLLFESDRLMSKRPRFRNRAKKPRFRLIRFLFRLFLAVFGLWLAGFAVFAVYVWAAEPPAPIPHAGGIVALTGGDDRVGTALALLAAKDAPALLISGAGRGTYLGDFTPDDEAAATQYAAAITLGHAAVTTRGNALETAAWAQARHIGSLLIVTADYHMPRALYDIQQRLPGVTLYAVPVRPPAMTHIFAASTLRLLAAEYTKYLFARAGLDQLLQDDYAAPTPPIQ